jgi:hypothetical protein
VAADRPFYSGKHRKHGMNLQVIASPEGEILWVSGALPGAVHDLTAARIWGIIAELAACGLVVLGDKGYLGEEHIRVRYRDGTSPPPRRRPTGLMPGCALPVSARTRSSRPGASCASSDAAPGAPGNSPKPSTFSRPAKSEDEKAHCLCCASIQDESRARDIRLAQETGSLSSGIYYCEDNSLISAELFPT